MLVENETIDFEHDVFSLVAIFIHFHFDSELVAIMVEIVRD